MKRKFKVMISLAVVIMIYLYACLVFTPKSYDDYGGNIYYAGKGYQAEEENSIDVYSVGNSDLYSGLIPAELYKNYGITAYNGGVAKQTVGGCISDVKKMFEKQDIKVLIVECDYFFESEGRGAAVKILSKIRFLGTPFEYHVRWKHLKAYDFYKIPNAKDNYDPLKGYKFDSKIYDYKIKDYMGNENASPEKISSRTKRGVKKLAELCEKEGAGLMFVSFPSPYSWNYAKHNAVKKLSEKYGIEFFDFNVNDEGVGFDAEKDFRDNGNHLNVAGAKKFTDFIGGYLKENYDLPDRKTQSLKTWNDAVRYFERLK